MGRLEFVCGSLIFWTNYKSDYLMKKIIPLTAFASILLASSSAYSAGFLLREQSVAGMGNAFAGATAGAEDGTYAFYNPAGIIRQMGTQASVSATAIVGDAKGYDAHGPNGSYDRQMDHVVDKSVLPSVVMTHALNSRMSVGLSLSAPFGLVTDYTRDWAGANHGTLSDLTTYDITPMAAYRATCNLTLGAGVVVQYVDATLKNGVLHNNLYGFPSANSKMSGDDTDVGYILGALYEYSPRTRFGVSYRSEVSHKLKGKIRFDNQMPALGLTNQDITAELETPALLTFGAYHDLNTKWSIMAEVQKTYWSSFDKLVINGKNGFSSTTNENWKNVWFYALGTSYKVNNQLKLRFGIAYDNTPVNDQTRTPRIPDSDRLWFSTGFEYKLNDDLVLNAGYSYIRAEKNEVNLKDPGNELSAKYKGNIHLFGLGFNYRF